MIKILRDGKFANWNHMIECPACGCVWVASPDEKEKLGANKEFYRCPQCQTSRTDVRCVTIDSSEFKIHW